jgi:HK97 family phage prohead protease
MPTAMKLPAKTEFKTFAFELKSIDEDQGLVTGYLSTFDNVDEQNDRVQKGAFRKTIAEAKSRMQNGRKFLYPALWMHDPEKPIGGVKDAEEDEHGLLVTMQLDVSTNAQGIPNNQLATMVFSGFKSGFIDELSMGYNAIQKDYQNGIRNLKECRLIESSAVTMLFAANPAALVSAEGVKNILGDNAVFEKSASGKTTWALADRDTKWDSSQANKDIQEYAADGDDLDWAKVAQCFFWIAENPPTKLGDCKLPFVANVDGKMMAIPQGVISCAGVLNGAMGGVDIPSGDIADVKANVAIYYKKMDMTPPWEDKEKSNGNKPMNRKTFEENYAQAACQDLLEDWSDVLLCAFTQSVLDACKIGDTMQSDVQAVLTAFNEQVMAWTAQAQQYGLSQYLTDNAYSPADYTMQNGADSYGYMARGKRPSGKVGARISEATKAVLDDHVNTVNDISKKMQNMSDELAQNAGSLQKKANDLTNLYQSEGQGSAFAEDNSDTGKSNSQGNQSEKRREPSQQTLTRKNQPPQSTEITIDDLEALLA